MYLLKDEEAVKPIYEGFSNVLRRDFPREALIKASQYESIPLRLIEKIEKQRDLKTLFAADLSLSASLFLLSEYFGDHFSKICSIYKNEEKGSFRVRLAILQFKGQGWSLV